MPQDLSETVRAVRSTDERRAKAVTTRTGPRTTNPAIAPRRPEARRSP